MLILQGYEKSMQKHTQSCKNMSTVPNRLVLFPRPPSSASFWAKHAEYIATMSILLRVPTPIT